MIPFDASSIDTLWGFPPRFAVCPACDWKYLIQPGLDAGLCPHCFHARLEDMQASADALSENLPYSSPPELVLPFTQAQEKVAESIQSFAGGIPYPPLDLTPQNLIQRMQRVYLPVWLVDARTQAEWQMEAGFDYQVVSHQDRYSDGAGGWRSEQVEEGRIRWEPRRGSLERTYSNVPAPALEEHASLRQVLGEFNVANGVPYEPRVVKEVYCRLPDRSQKDAWPDALPALQVAAAWECKQAAGADHARDFRWSPQFPELNWTLMLAPVFSSYYLDDEGQPQRVIMHGQSGAISGMRRSSMKRAGRTAWILAGIAALLFVLSLILGASGIIVAPLLPVAAIGAVVAIALALGALIPLYVASSFNRREKAKPASVTR